MAEGLVNNPWLQNLIYPLCFFHTVIKAGPFLLDTERRRWQQPHPHLLAPCFPTQATRRAGATDASWDSSFSLWLPQHSAGQTHNLATRCEGSQGSQDGSEGGGICYAGNSLVVTLRSQSLEGMEPSDSSKHPENWPPGTARGCGLHFTWRLLFAVSFTYGRVQSKTTFLGFAVKHLCNIYT